jgi:regulator of sigma E protease
MEGLLSILNTSFDLLLVMAGFTLIIILHELGHFLAARWAGIRVLAFAVGFGPALCSWRQGLGWRRGSSEDEYLALGERAASVSSTEYRVNVLPLGGYVRMLGQDDADPTAVSDAPDSYQKAAVWKRMIVISAGVVMNVITAGLLFVLVFMVGLRTEPAVVGDVAPRSPAALAVADNAAAAGVTEPGLKARDRIISIDGRAPDSFKDVSLQVAMSRKGQPVELLVERPGVREPLRFRIVPRESELTRMLDLGFGPVLSAELIGAGRRDSERAEIERLLADLGAPGVAAGSTLVRVEGREAASFYDLLDACRASGGQPVSADFRTPDGSEHRVTINPAAEIPTAQFETPSGRTVVSHVLGLMPVMTVRQTLPAGVAAGLQAGDVFARLGDLEWPGVPEGIAEIHRGKRASIPAVVARPDQLVDLGAIKVTRGKIGFGYGSTAETAARISRWPIIVSLAADPQTDSAGAANPSASSTSPAHSESRPAGGDPAARNVPSGAKLGLAPGTRIVRVNERPVANFSDLRNALQAAVAADPQATQQGVRVTLHVEPPLRDGAAPRSIDWSIPASEARELAALGWFSPLGPSLFKLEQIELRGNGPLQAIELGVRETHRVMLSTYLTFARLFQGSVKVEHLKGPVGIAHVGTIIADRGFIWLLFFMAVISVNLAVINFLPLPIVDGGHFLFLLYEQLTGKAVSVLVQNVATLAGLALIGSVFLVVTFNDLANLLWR